MATGIFGKRAGNAIVPYADSTRRTKEVQLSLSGTPSGWSQSYARGIAYATSDGDWYLSFKIRGSATAASSLSVDIDGITSLNEVDGIQNIENVGSSVAAGNFGFVLQNDNTVTVNYSSAQTILTCNGTIRLDSQPTDAFVGADGNFATFSEALENQVDASVYVEPATESTQGLVNQGVAVADAAGANPTKAEFDALLNSLRNAGVINT